MSDRTPRRRSPIVFEWSEQQVRPGNDNAVTWSSTVVPLLPVRPRPTSAIACFADDARYTIEAGRRTGGGQAIGSIQVTLANDTLVFVAEPIGE